MRLLLVALLFQTLFWWDDDIFLKFKWTPAEYEDGTPWEGSYNVYISKNEEEWVKTATVDTETYTIHAEPGNAYRMKVCVVAPGGEEGEFSPVSDYVVCLRPVPARMLAE